MSQGNSFCQYLPKSKKRPPRKSKPRRSKSRTPKAHSRTLSKSFLVASGNTPTSRSRKRSTHKPPKPVPHIDTRDLNIFHIDAQIRRKLESKITAIPELYRELQSILWILNHGKNPVDKVLAKQKASILRKKIQDLETTLELGLYLFRTSDILEEYRNLLTISGPQSFVSHQESTMDKDAFRKQELISQFLCVAQEYVKIDHLNQPLEKIICQECRSFDFQFDDENSIYVCKECGTEVEVLDDSPSFKDTDRVNMSSRFSYSRRGHFIDATRKYQGLQNIDPKKIARVVEVLKEEMKLHSLTVETVTKDHIYMFLSEKRLSRHYEDLNLLYHIITGKPCPNISALEDDLLDDFDKQEEKLAEVLEDERDNSLNVNYKLYKLLQRRGFPCQKDDFYILKTKTKEDEHDEAMKAAWAKLAQEEKEEAKRTGIKKEDPTWDWIPTF